MAFEPLSDDDDDVVVSPSTTGSAAKRSVEIFGACILALNASLSAVVSVGMLAAVEVGPSALYASMATLPLALAYFTRRSALRWWSFLASSLAFLVVFIFLGMTAIYPAKWIIAAGAGAMVGAMVFAVGAAIALLLRPFTRYFSISPASRQALYDTVSRLRG